MQRHRAKGGIESPVTDMPAIVGAGFPRPTGWETQPLRIPPPVFPFHELRSHLSPLWGFKTFVYRVFYKHAAPLGLNAAMHQNSRWDIQRRGEVSKPDGLGNPTPTNSMVGWCLCFLSVQSAESVLIRDSDGCHMSPLWGFVVFGYAAVL